MKPDRFKGKSKQWNIVLNNSIGFVEDVYGTGVSFNVYRGSLVEKNTKFVQSCYTLETAKTLLAQL